MPKFKEFSRNANTINLNSDSHLLKKKKLFASVVALQKCFLFHLKSSFRSQDIKIFVLTFWGACRKNSLMRKIRSISKFMTVNKELQHILPNISQIKGNQTMKFGHLIEHTKVNIFL